MPYMRRKGLNGRLALAIAAAALGSSFQHGYNTGVVNAPEKIIEDWIKEVRGNSTGAVSEKTIYSGIVSIFCIGGMIGGSLVGTVADICGRKGGLLLNNILVLIAVIFQGFAKSAGSYEMLYVGRLVIGINAGLNAGLAPMYLAEISPMHLRGAIGTAYQLIITISILVSQVLGIEELLGTADKWPLLLCLTIVPAIFQVATLPLCPESPKYLLLSKGKDMESQRALSWLRGTIEVHDEMEEMRSEYESMKLVQRVTLKELFINSALRIPLVIAVMIMLAQQLTGINAIMSYSTSIFISSNISEKDAQYATMGMGAVNVVMTLVSLVLVEKAGRKTLLLAGFGGMLVVTSSLAISFAFKASGVFPVILVILFVVFFATGPGSIPWFLVSELFAQSARPAATSVAIAVNWAANFLVNIGFPSLNEALGGYVFVIFAVLQLVFILFIYKKVPETKNKTMEEISSMFRQRSYQ